MGGLTTYLKYSLRGCKLPQLINTSSPTDAVCGTGPAALLIGGSLCSDHNLTQTGIIGRLSVHLKALMNIQHKYVKVNYFLE